MRLDQLIKQKASIELIITHENFINEIQNNNQQLINFILSDKKHLSFMIDVITVCHEHNVNNKIKGYQIPFLVSQFFEIANGQILNYILDDQQFLHQLFNFVNCKQEVNATLAAYFCKLIFSFLTVEPEKFLHFIYNNLQIMLNLHQQSHILAISDIICQLFQVSQSLSSLNKPNFTHNKIQLFNNIINTVSQSDDQCKVINNFQILNDFISTHFYNQFIDGTKIISSFLQQIDVFFHRYFNNINVRKNLELIKLVSVYYSIIIFESNQQHCPELESKEYLMFVKSICMNLKGLQNSLNNQQQEFRLTQNNIKQQMAGHCRLVFVEIINELVIINDKYIIQQFIACNTINLMIEFLVRFQWNNVLHSNIEVAFINLINNKNTDLLDELFIKKKIYNIFIEEIQNIYVESTNVNGFLYTKGNIGFLIKIANHFNESTYIRKIISQSQIWNEFVQKQLNMLNSKLNINILDINLRQTSSLQLQQLVSKKSISFESVNTGLNLFVEDNNENLFQELQKQIDKKLGFKSNESSDLESDNENEKEAVQKTLSKRTFSTGIINVINNTMRRFSVELMKDDIKQMKFRKINQNDKQFLQMLNVCRPSEDFLKSLISQTKQKQQQLQA